MKKLEEQTRRDIAAFLPEAIEMALQSYQEYAMEQVTNDEVLAATGFKAHHDACKVALSHIKALVDLAKWVDLPGSENAEGLRSAEVAALIISAQKEIDEGKE